MTVRLERCGAATARYLDGKGRPLADYLAAPDVAITPGAWGDYGAARAKGELLADAGSLTNLDRHNYWDRIKTDARGRITFPALIPCATYRIERWEQGLLGAAQGVHGSGGEDDRPGRRGDREGRMRRCSVSPLSA